eukprot:37554_1
MMQNQKEPSLQFTRRPNSKTEFVIADDLPHRCKYTSPSTNIKRFECSLTSCPHQFYTLNGKFYAYAKKENQRHHAPDRPGAIHQKWTTEKQNKNTLLVQMTDEIKTNGSDIHSTYRKHIVHNDDEAISIPMYKSVRKTLQKAKQLSGKVMKAPTSGLQANKMVEDSSLSHNIYGQTLMQYEKDLDMNEMEILMSEYACIEEVRAERSEIQQEIQELNKKLQQLDYIEVKKFLNYGDKDGMQYLGGDDVYGMYQCWANKENVIAFAETNLKLADGSWGGSPLLSVVCKERNWFRMELTLYAGFNNSNNEKCPLIIKCCSILFHKDKPSKEDYVEALEFLGKRCKEEYSIDPFEDKGFINYVMGDFERPMRNAFLEVIANCVLLGCFFHFCKCLLKYWTDLGFTKYFSDKKYYTFYYFMRCFMMLALLPEYLIETAFLLLISISALFVPSELYPKFEQFVDYFVRIWFNLYPTVEWCCFGSFLRNNNGVESNNFVMIHRYGKHPTYEQWCRNLAEQFAYDLVRYKQFIQHGKTNHRSPKERLKNEILELEWDRITKDESDESIILFLKRTSLAMKLSAKKLEEMKSKYYNV